MVLATGYFAKAKQYADLGYALVSIAKVAPWFLPKGLKVYPLDCLAPTDDILALKDSPDKYTPKYQRDILSHLKPTDVYHKLWMISHQEQKDKVVLMCYESPEKFCHRHLVANWLNEKLRVNVEEVVALVPKKKAIDFFDSSEES